VSHVTSVPALDVAIGLAFVYFVLAIVCSAVNEVIASALKWRAKDLEKGLASLLRGEELRFKAHPLIAALVPSLPAGKLAAFRKRFYHPYPSYIPSRTFTAALLGLGYDDKVTPTNTRALADSIEALQNTELKSALVSLYHTAQGDPIEFRRAVERWYDDAMERVSGWYRRRIQKVLWALAIVVAILINADTLQMAKQLWTQPSTRSVLVTQAESAASRGKAPMGNAAAKHLKKLPLPLGWHWTTRRSDAQAIPSSTYDVLAKIVGLLLTAVALSFGAPFWFDTLSKLARLRNSGAPPPASDAVRRGEGEERRAGPGAAPAL
jgi:hypothetical protein